MKIDFHINLIKLFLGYTASPAQCVTTRLLAEQCDGKFSSKKVPCDLQYFKIESCPLGFPHFPDGFAEPFLSEIRNCRVLGHGNVISPDGQKLSRDSTHDFGGGATGHWIVEKAPLLRPTSKLTGDFFVATVNLCSNYYHWLFEEVPRILDGLSQKKSKILVSCENRVHKEFVSLLKIQSRVKSVSGYSHFHCENLLIPSLPGRLVGGKDYDATLPTQDTVDLLVGLGQQVTPNQDWLKNEKIYITRKNCLKRRILNENEIEHFLTNRGFQILEMEKLTLSQQIMVFQNARVIVSPHGAGLANLVFCQSGTRVVEMFSRRYFNWLYFYLSQLKSLHHLCIFEPGQSDIKFEECYADFAIAIDDLDKALKSFS